MQFQPRSLYAKDIKTQNPPKRHAASSPSNCGSVLVLCDDILTLCVAPKVRVMPATMPSRTNPEVPARKADLFTLFACAESELGGLPGPTTRGIHPSCTAPPGLTKKGGSKISTKEDENLVEIPPQKERGLLPRRNKKDKEKEDRSEIKVRCPPSRRFYRNF